MPSAGQYTRNSTSVSSYEPPQPIRNSASLQFVQASQTEDKNLQAGRPTIHQPHSTEDLVAISRARSPAGQPIKFSPPRVENLSLGNQRLNDTEDNISPASVNSSRKPPPAEKISPPRFVAPSTEYTLPAVPGRTIFGGHSKSTR